MINIPRNRWLASLVIVLVAVSAKAQSPYTIDVSQGQELNRKVFGQNVPTIGESEAFEEAMNSTTVEATGGGSIRGVAGGLAADTYDWQARTGRWVGEPSMSGRPTLEYLRYARDQQAELFVTVNVRGTGTGNSSSDFQWVDTSLPPLTTLAADWVRYANYIAPQYRQGDTLSSSDAAIVNALDWGSYNRLLTPQEAPTSKVKYWEIGNEPDIGIPDYQGENYVSLSPAEYADRYAAITTAMLAVDPTIKVGPVVKRGVNDEGTAPDPWLLAVLARHDAQVDFISYHPYMNIFHPYLTEGQLPTTGELEERLRGVKQKQESEYSLIQWAISTNNSKWWQPRRNINTPAAVTEWNVGSAAGNGSFVTRSMAQALGAAETMFTLAENSNILAAHYWTWPVSYWEGLPTPLYRLYEALEEHAGDTFVDSYSDDENLRMYVTADTAKSKIALWGLNFSDTTDKSIQFSLDNAGWDLDEARVTLLRLARVDGSDTSLLDFTSNLSSDPQSIDWISTDLTGLIDLSDFELTFDDATVTLLLVESIPEPGAGMMAAVMFCFLAGRRRC